MPEDFEEPAAERFDYRRYLEMLRRRHVLFVVLVLGGWLLVWGSSWLLPAQYKSSTLIVVDQPTVSKAFVSSDANDNSQERLQNITQQIMSRTALLTIIDKLHLYANGKDDLTPDEKVERMRKDIDVELVRDQRSGSITAFRVSYIGQTPKMAHDVTGELTSLFINSNENAQRQQSVQATQFLRSQVAAARVKLAEQSARVNAFQSAHEGQLPSQQATNLQILSGLQARLQSQEDALNTANQQRVYEQSLLEQYRNMAATGSSGSSSPSGLTAINKQLNTLQLKLADLRTRYTARYPGIQELQEQIARTQQARRELIAKLNAPSKMTPQKGSGAHSGAVLSADSGPMAQVESQLQANKIDIANREAAVASLKSRIRNYQARLNAQPAVEQELAELKSSYQQAQANYNDLLKKENESQMATSLAQTQGGQAFTVLDPPSMPLRPSSPKRLKMWAAGLAAGLVLAVLGVGVAETVDDRIHSEEEIDRLMPVGVIAEIPEISGPGDEKRSKRYAFMKWAMTAMVCVTILAGAAVSYLHV